MPAFPPLVVREETALEIYPPVARIEAGSSTRFSCWVTTSVMSEFPVVN